MQNNDTDTLCHIRTCADVCGKRVKRSAGLVHHQPARYSWCSKKGSQENKEACSSKIPAVILVEKLVMDPEELVVCPYDPVHRVARKRMQYHLIKCRKVSVRSLSPVCCPV